MAILALVASGWLESLNGSTYVFGAYSQALKLSLRLNQKSLDAVAFFATLGCSCGIGPALLHSYCSPRSIVLLGLAHSTIGYFFTWIAIENPSQFALWHLCLFQFISGSAQTYIQTATLVAGVKSFSSSRGFVVGYLKACVGLSASILLQFSAVLCNSREDCLPLMLSWLLPALSVLPALALPSSTVSNLSSPKPPDFRSLSAILITLSVYLFLSLVIQRAVSLSRAAVGMIFLGMCVILISPVVVVVKSGQTSSQQISQLQEQEPEERRNFVECGGEFTTVEAVSTLNFWLLFLVVLISTGSTAAISSNLGQLGNSLGYSSPSITLCVSLYSICSCFGRIGSGLLSERFLQKRRTPRPNFLTIAVIAVSLSLVLGGLAVEGALFFVSVLAGLAEGAIWCLAIAISSELFGLSCFASILNLITSACPLGDLLLSVSIVGPLYDSHAHPGDDDRSLLCFGPNCFRTSFLILALCCLIAAAFSALLSRKTIKAYGTVGLVNDLVN